MENNPVVEILLASNPHDMNGDGVADYTDPALVKLSSGNYGVVWPVDDAGIVVGETYGGRVLQTSTGSPWKPASGTRITGIFYTDSGKADAGGQTIWQLNMLEKGGTTKAPTYKLWTFNETQAAGQPVAKAAASSATALTLPRVLALESQYGLDLNADAAIGDKVVQIFLNGQPGESGSADWIGPYLVKVASGAYGLVWIHPEDGPLQVGDTPYVKFLQTTTGTSWQPSAGTTITGVFYSEKLDASGQTISQRNLVEQGGTAKAPTYKLWTFNEMQVGGQLLAKATATSAAALTLTQLLSLESQYGLDLNGDAAIGDKVVQILLDGRPIDEGQDGSTDWIGPYLVKVVSGAHGLVWVRPDDEPLKVGDTPYVKLLQTTTGANWQPSAGTTITGVLYSESGGVSQQNLVEKSGTAKAPTYKLWTFNESPDQPYAKASGTAATALTLTQLLALESQYGLDLNGDGVTGDKVAQILLEGRPIDEGQDGSTDWIGPYLVKVASGAHGLVWVRPDDEPLKVGDTPYVKLLQTTTGANWQPSAGTTITGVLYSESGGVSQQNLVEKSGTAKAPTYKLWTFNTSPDQPYAKASGTAATALTLAQLLALESQHKLDLNGDVAIGDKVAQILLQGQTFDRDHDGAPDAASPYLVKLSSGGYGLISGYRDVSVDKTFPTLLLQTSAGANWVPASGTTITGVFSNEKDGVAQHNLVEKGGTAQAPTYKLWTFTPSPNQPYAKASGTAATALTLAQLLGLESQHQLDLNGDKAIGDAVAQILLTGQPFDRDQDGAPDGVGPYLVKLTSGSYGLITTAPDETVSVGETRSTLLLQTSTGANWVPTSGTTITGVFQSEKSGVPQQNLVEKGGTAQAPTYKVWTFSPSANQPVAKASSTAATALTLTQLLGLEAQHKLDLNGDKAIGDAVAQILLTGQPFDRDQDGAPDGASPYLVKLTSGSYGLITTAPDETLSVGQTRSTLLLQTSTGANWVPTSGTTITGVFQSEKSGVPQQNLVEKGGTAQAPTYKVWTFNPSANQPVAKASGTAATALTLTQLLGLESQHKLDFNGDNAIGDAVAQILLKGQLVDWDEDGVPDSRNSPDLVKLTSGSYGLIIMVPDEAVRVGQTYPTQSLQTSTGANWMPTSGTTITGMFYSAKLDASGEWITQRNLIEQGGTAKAPTYKLWTFDESADRSYAKAGSATATPLTLTQLLSLESKYDLDFNGDKVIGDTVAQIFLAGRPFDQDNDGIPDAFSPHLVKLGSGGYGLISGEQDVSVGQTYTTLLLQTSTGANWVPTSGTTITLAFYSEKQDASGDRIWQSNLVEKGGTAKNPTYKVWTFNDSPYQLFSKASGTAATAPTLTQLLSLESQFNLDLNGDKVIGDAVAQILLEGLPFDRDEDGEPDGIGPYLVKLSSGAYGLIWTAPDETLSVGQAHSTLLLQTSTGANWVPASGTKITGVFDSHFSEHNLIEQGGTAKAPTYKVWTFNESRYQPVAKASGTSATPLTLTQLLSLESQFNLDFNGDKVIGETVAQILLSAQQLDRNDDGWTDGVSPYLVKLSSGAYGLMWMNLDEVVSVGQRAYSLLLQTSTGTNWVPTSGTTITGVFDSNTQDANGNSIQQHNLVEQGGTAGAPTYKVWTFDRSPDWEQAFAKASSPVATELTLAQLFSLESQYHLDLNGDKLIGDTADPVPLLISSTPQDNGTLEVTQDLNLYFSEAIHAGSGTIRLYQSDDSLVQSFDVSTFSKGGGNYIGGSKVNLNPTNNLVAGTEYYVKIDAGALLDSSGQAYAGISDATTLNFTAFDAAPTLAYSTPEDEGVLEVTQALDLSFSEAVQAGSGWITLSKADGTVVEAFDVTTGQGTNGGSVSFDRNWVALDPGSNLTAGQGYYVQVDATAVRDTAGQVYGGISDATTLNFTAVDTAPTLTYSRPQDNRTLDITQNLYLYFSEAVLAGIGRITLSKADGTRVEAFDVTTGLGANGGTVSFYSDVIALNPGLDLTGGQSYYVEVDATAVRDTTGQVYAGISDTTTLNFTAVDPVPMLDYSTPQDDGTLEITQDLNLYFSEAVHAGSGAIQLYKSDNSLVESFDVSTFSQGGKGGGNYMNGANVTLNPTNNLVAGTEYYVKIDAGALLDASNQAYAGISDATTLNFTAVDPVPALWGSTPQDGGTLEITQDLNLYFSEAVHAGSGAIQLYKSDDSLVESFDVSTFSQGGKGGGNYINGANVTLNPTNNLVAGTEYYVKIDAGALLDASNQAYAGISDATTLNFTAVDPAPTLRASTPRDNETLEVTQDLYLVYSETVQAGAGRITLYKADGTLVEAFDVVTGQGTSDGKVSFHDYLVELNPGQNLAGGQSYYVQVDATAVRDSTGQAYAGISDATTLNFTAAADPVPTLSSSTPEDNGTLEVTQDLYLNFSEAIQAASGQISLYKADGSVVEAFDVATGQGTNGGAVFFYDYGLTFNPGENLTAGQSYYVQVDATAVRDTTGQAYAGISDATTLNFTAIDPAPTLSDSTPQDDGTLEITQDLYLNFSEAIQAGSGQIWLYKTDGSVVEAFDVTTGQGANAGTVSFYGSKIALDPGSNLTGGQSYYVQVDATAVRDTNGQAYAGISDATTLNFTAVDSVPTLAYSTPEDNGTLEVTQDLYLYFSETAQAGSGQINLYAADGSVVETFDVATGQGANGGTVSFNRNWIALDPGSNLTAGQSYYVQVDATAVRDTMGQAYAGISDATTLNFTAVDPVPTLWGSTPQDNGALEIRQSLFLNFSEPIQGGAGLITLYKTDGSVVEAFDVTTGQGANGGAVYFIGYGVVLDPGSNLTVGQDYYLLADKGAIKDLTDNDFLGLVGVSDLNFTAL